MPKTHENNNFQSQFHLVNICCQPDDFLQVFNSNPFCPINIIQVKQWKMQRLKRQLSKPKDGDYDYLAKIVIIGNSAVGKTNILLRFIDKNYSMSHTPTIGVDFRSKIIEVALANKNDKRRIKLQLWDTAGQERFRTLTDTYFKGASGIVIVYAVDDRRSFEDVGNWMMQLQQNGASKLPKLIVGNKCDLREQRKVGAQQGRMLADQCKCTFMEVSAKENINIQQMFSQLAMSIAGEIREELNNNKDGKEGKVSTLLINQPKENNKQCCSN